MVGVLRASVFNAEIVDAEGESDTSPLVGPEARDKGSLTIALGVDPLL